MLTTGGPCAQHRVDRQHAVDARRASSTERGYGPEWRHARKVFLQAHPLCAECAKDDRVTAASHVDHIVPHQGDERLFWDRANWQALCATHHSRKTAAEDGGFGNRRRFG